MSSRLPRRTLRDWHPQTDPPEADWLAGQYDAGGRSGPVYGGRGTTVSIGGNQPVHRWAMVEISQDAAAV